MKPRFVKSLVLSCKDEEDKCLVFSREKYCNYHGKEQNHHSKIVMISPRPIHKPKY